MPGKPYYVTLILFILLIFNLTADAEMAGEKYRITRSVFSAGGTFASSSSFQIKGTLGQPSPLMAPLDPPFSDNYDLYPGFWYTVQFSNSRKVNHLPAVFLLLLDE